MLITMWKTHFALVSKIANYNPKHFASRNTIMPFLSISMNGDLMLST